MQVQKLSLSERFRRLKSGQAAHPEYTGCIIRRWADIPIVDYFAIEGEEKAKKERATLRSILDISEQEEKGMTYRDMAMLINHMRNQPGQDHRAPDEAAILLATPMIGCYKKIQEAKNAAKTK